MLEDAKNGVRQVYFVDAAHFTLSPYVGYLWSFIRVWVKAPSGRKRWNVLGALNAANHQLVSVENESYINAKSVCELMDKLKVLHGDQKITVILDNVRYQKCQLVWEKARDLNMDLVYLPSYSPNLNLIERLWKFVKKTCLNSRYYEKFADFKGAIKECLSQTHTLHKEALDKLLTHSFQTFDQSNIMAL